MLAVEGLRVETSGGAEIVDEVSFNLEAGKLLAIVGESGCGKTTSALALLGHARAGTRIAGGRILLDGNDLLALSSRELRRLRGRHVSYVAQDPSASLSPRIRIGAQIAEALEVHGTSHDDSRARARQLIDQVHLPVGEEFLERYPFELSGGQQQRVAIAMALACKPRVVVLDEPTTGLDVTTQARILELVKELRDTSGLAFLYVTHDLAVVDGLADEVAVMYAGRIVEAGPRERVLRRPAHPYTALLLESVPRVAVRHELEGIPGTAPPPRARPPGCFFAERCPLAEERCRLEFPPVSAVTSNHSARCWRLDDVGGLVTRRSLREDDVGAAGKGLFLSVKNLRAGYGRGWQERPVLPGVSLAVAPGECVALVGESGSGKTTLGRCIAGLHPSQEGELRLLGNVLAPVAPKRTLEERRALQIVFQNPDRSLNPNRTIAQSVGRPLRLFGHSSRSGERAAVRELLERVRLPGSYLDRFPRELSGGEKQRVAIARALAAQPGLIVCDEITSALDVSIQAAIVSLLGELQAGGLALLFITHNLALVNSIADRVVVLEAGVVREEGTASEVIHNPQHDYTRELVAAAPDLGTVHDSDETPVRA